MRPQKLNIKNFRNICDAELAIAPGLTYLLGDNAQGKTSILEALAYSMTLRPLRSVRVAELIQNGTEQAHLHLQLQGPSLPWEIDINVTPRGRQIRVNGKNLRDPAQLLGAVAVVCFTPDDLALVRGAPEGRRRSLDRFAFGVQASHLKNLRDYQRALRSRNHLLRRGDVDPASLAAYSETLIRSGAAVMLGRQRAVALLAEPARHRHAQLSPQEEDLGLRYRPAMPCVADLTEQMEVLRQAFAKTAARDRQRRLTTLGPHVDDLEILLAGQPARHRASQGQTRSLVLALRLAEVDELRCARGQAPVLLADDLLAELDPHRSQALFATLDDAGACVVATGTRLPDKIDHRRADLRIYRVEAGRLRSF